VEMDRVETEASADEENDTRVTDTSLYWPRNRGLASDASAANSNSLFSFEKQSK